MSEFDAADDSRKKKEKPLSELLKEANDAMEIPYAKEAKEGIKSAISDSGVPGAEYINDGVDALAPDHVYDLLPIGKIAGKAVKGGKALSQILGALGHEGLTRSAVAAAAKEAAPVAKKAAGALAGKEAKEIALDYAKMNDPLAGRKPEAPALDYSKFNGPAANRKPEAPEMLQYDRWGNIISKPNRAGQ